MIWRQTLPRAPGPGRRGSAYAAGSVRSDQPLCRPAWPDRIGTSILQGGKRIGHGTSSQPRAPIRHAVAARSISVEYNGDSRSQDVPHLVQTHTPRHSRGRRRGPCRRRFIAAGRRSGIERARRRPGDRPGARIRRGALATAQSESRAGAMDLDAVRARPAQHFRFVPSRIRPLGETAARHRPNHGRQPLPSHGQRTARRVGAGAL